MKLEVRRRQRRKLDPRWAPTERAIVPVDAEKTTAILSRTDPHVVFTGLGLGEFVMIRRVADALRKAKPGVKISVALRDNLAMEHVRRHEPQLNVSWWPDDVLLPNLRWLASQRPDVVVLTEGCRQTALVVAGSRYGARIVVMNGRIRDRRVFHHPLFRLFQRWPFRGFTAMGMQNEDYAAAVRDLAPPGCDLVVSGDLKTDFQVPTLSRERREGLETWLASGPPIVAAGSTDNVEEERMVVRAFLATRATTPCRLLLAPRHPSDLGELPATLIEAGLTFSRRSEGQDTGDVLLLDTQGELAIAYRACVAAYVGGSYSPRGNGHNPIEPLTWGVPVAYGRRRGHFAEIQTMLEEGGVGTRVSGSEELAAFWTRFLCDPEKRARVGLAGARLVDGHRGAVDKTVAMLLRQLEAIR